MPQEKDQVLIGITGLTLESKRGRGRSRTHDPWGVGLTGAAYVAVALLSYKCSGTGHDAAPPTYVMTPQKQRHFRSPHDAPRTQRGQIVPAHARKGQREPEDPGLSNQPGETKHMEFQPQ